MAKKKTSDKKTDKKRKELEATVERLKSELRQSNARVARWKQRVADLEKASVATAVKVNKLKKQRNKARDAAASALATPAAPEAPAPVATPAPPAPSVVADPAPDASWTVVQLRAEARARGLTGLSGKSKAELIDALQ